MNLYFFYVLILFLISWKQQDICFAAETTKPWTYTGSDGPTEWSTTHPAMCAGYMQSPISLDYFSSTYLRTLMPITLYQGNVTSEPVTFVNNKYSIVLILPSKSWFVSYNTMRNYEYVLHSIHFHWGKSNHLGSEHHLDNKIYPIEAHIVCYRLGMYETFELAAVSAGGLAVLGFLMEINDNLPASWLSTIPEFLTELRLVRKPLESGTLPSFNVQNLLNFTNTATYYRYQGSLTSPPCVENVIWTVFTKPVPITTQELTAFRMQLFPNTESSPTMGNNYRPIQPLNPASSLIPRIVYRSWKNSLSSASVRYSLCTLIGSVALKMLLLE